MRRLSKCPNSHTLLIATDNELLCWPPFDRAMSRSPRSRTAEVDHRCFARTSVASRCVPARIGRNVSEGQRTELVVFSNLTAVRRDQRLLLTRKFVQGMEQYVSLWNGPVRCLVRTVHKPTTDLDHLEVSIDALPFAVDVVDSDPRSLRRCLGTPAVIVGSTDYMQNHLSVLAREAGIPIIYVCEYSLRTRLQVARSEVLNPLRLAGRSVWEARQELRQRRAIRLAQGIQCNGTPTYEAYRGLTPSPLLYFDTRTTESMIATEDAVAKRVARSLTQARLRLAFSGRLVPMKGAEHLIRVAAALKARNVNFELTVYGSGSSEPAMRSAISRLGLHSQVHLAGTVDFAKQLAPRLRDETDLFVCCHRQGDPSCTYLETLACGVPIVGYANEAWLGLLRHVKAGAAVPLDDVDALAGCIARIAADRTCLGTWSSAALPFAREHSFEKTFARRVGHYRAVAEEHAGRQRMVGSRVLASQKPA